MEPVPTAPPHVDAGSEPHAIAAGDVAAQLGTALGRGLSEAEAQRRLARDGPNALPIARPPSVVALVIRQFRDGMVALLAGAAVISLAIGEVLDGVVIAAILVANAVLGAVQEGRAEAAARAVRALVPARARIIRDGAPRELDAAAVVVGDLVALAAGDRVPADGRLVETARTAVDESLLTGESVPVEKRSEPPVPREAALAERTTMVFASTTLVRGRAGTVVTATGLDTELGRIAALSTEGRPPTPLERRLDRFAGVLLRGTLGVCAVLALSAWLYGDSAAHAFLVGISLAVAAVPEGLAAVVTVTLALGMRRLAERGAIVRRLRTVETLGSTTVICADKTGTLTRNAMTVTDIEVPDDQPSSEAELLAAALLASDSPTDPVDAALIDAGAPHGLDRERLLAHARTVGGEPFDAQRRLASVVVEYEGGERAAFVKGAPEALLPRLRPGGEDPALQRAARRLTDDGKRVLLVAQRRGLGVNDEPERQLVALGLIGLADPPRPSARPSVETAQAAGIRTVMITGDHPGTARSVARACGLHDATVPDALITGAQLDRMSDAQLRRRAPRLAICARVAPAHKLRIVKALQANGEVVAMTGDGVNDVPALGAADVGVAMGRGGSDAAIDAADIVLTDNDFATIVSAVEGGRTIYRNILRFIHFLLAANTGEVLTFALAVLGGLGAPLTVLQILLINLLTDGLPAVALGLDPPHPALMRRAPRPRSQALLEPIGRRLLAGGAAIGAAGFASFVIGRSSDLAAGRTMAFTTLVFAQLAYVFAIRGGGWFWRAERNRALGVAVALSAAIEVVVLAVPAIAERFGVVPISPGQLAVALALALVPFAAAEIVKAARR